MTEWEMKASKAAREHARAPARGEEDESERRVVACVAGLAASSIQRREREKERTKRSAGMERNMEGEIAR